VNRRSFLAVLAAAFVGDPERLLWLPGKKLISIPAEPRLIHGSGNRILTADVISHKILEILLRNLVFAKQVNSDYNQLLNQQAEIAAMNIRPPLLHPIS
jgi:hypothetical protein